jgi:hypothetical protein
MIPLSPTTKKYTNACATTVSLNPAPWFNPIKPFLGIDQHLAKHIAHLFIRDPLVVFSETIDQDDTSSMDHFEVSLTTATPLIPAQVPFRTFNLQIGKLYDSNHLQQTLQSAGESNSGAWKYRSPTLKMRRLLCSLSSFREQSSVSTLISTFLYLKLVVISITKDTYSLDLIGR